MARKRMIDPSIWTDEGMADLTPRQQLLYIGLFSNADDEGRLKGSPASLALMLPTIYSGSPRGEVAEDLARVLSVMRQVVRYEADGREYLAFLNYRQWQRIDKPSASVLPPPPEKTAYVHPDSPTPPRMVGEPSANALVGVPPKLKEEKLKEEKRREEHGASRGHPADVRQTPPKREAPPPGSNAHYSLYLAYVEEAGADEADLPKTFKDKQKTVAARLYADGISEADVRGCLGWLKSQTWRTAGIDLTTVQSEVGKWIADKRPAVAASRASPGKPASEFGNRIRQNAERARQILNGSPAIDDDTVIETTGRIRAT